MTIVDDLGNSSPANTNFVFNADEYRVRPQLRRAPSPASFRNRWMPSANAIWSHGSTPLPSAAAFLYAAQRARPNERTNTGIENEVGIGGETVP